MYGHPCAVVFHASMLAPSRRAFWRFYKGRAVQAPLLPQHLQVKSAVEFQNGTGPHAK